MFSFGVLFFQILTGITPYAGFSKSDFYRRVVELGERPPLYVEGNSAYKHVQALERDLISSCWDADPRKRPSMSEACAIIQTLSCPVNPRGSKKMDH